MSIFTVLSWNFEMFPGPHFAELSDLFGEAVVVLVPKVELVPVSLPVRETRPSSIVVLGGLHIEVDLPS